MSDRQEDGAGKKPKRKRPARAAKPPARNLRHPRAPAAKAAPETPPEPTEPPMDIHKPKPIHSWRELGTEIGVIVIGILIALGLEQAVESYHAHEKAATAQEALDAEMSQNLVLARSWADFEDCSERQLAVLLKAIGRGNQQELRRLGDASSLPPPTSWSDAAWQSVLASDVIEDFDDETRRAYSTGYYIVGRMRGYQERYIDASRRLFALAQSDTTSVSQIAGAEYAEIAEVTAALDGLQLAVSFVPQGQRLLGLADLPSDQSRNDAVTRCNAAADKLEAMAGGG